jgi:hypothetical protein
MDWRTVPFVFSQFESFATCALSLSFLLVTYLFTLSDLLEGTWFDFDTFLVVFRIFHESYFVAFTNAFVTLFGTFLFTTMFLLGVTNVNFVTG